MFLWISLCLSCLGLIELHGSASYFFIQLEKLYSRYFFKYFPVFVSTSLASSDSDYTYVKCLMLFSGPLKLRLSFLLAFCSFFASVWLVFALL